MNERAKIQTLLSEFEKSRTVLSKIVAYYRRYLEETQNVQAKTTEQAIVLADVFVSYYTCLETLFLRASQFFENDLNPEKWHQDLLHKMSLRIEGIRDHVISDETAALLAELLKFRHFKRYYFEFDYDWDRIDFVRKIFDRLRPVIDADLNPFAEFLRRLSDKVEVR